MQIRECYGISPAISTGASRLEKLRNVRIVCLYRKVPRFLARGKENIRIDYERGTGWWIVQIVHTSRSMTCFIHVDYPQTILVHINATFTHVKNIRNFGLTFLPTKNLSSLFDDDFLFIVRNHDPAKMLTPLARNFDPFFVAEDTIEE